VVIEVVVDTNVVDAEADVTLEADVTREVDVMLEAVLMVLLVELGGLATMAPVLSKKTPRPALQHWTSSLQQ
jgi:hypothetical protein